VRERSYNFGYLDEATKRSLRRAILKSVAIPGHQIPFGSREMPIAFGWGTGALQINCALLGPTDTLKVIDQGADDTVNAISLKKFLHRMTGVRLTEQTSQASVIQTRHRIPETPLRAGQIMVYQVPIPEPLRFLEPREIETRKLHAYGEYGAMYLKLYEDLAHHGESKSSYDHPVTINGYRLSAPSPIPKFDNPKLHHSPALQLFGAGREQRCYAIPPYTNVESLSFQDHPFRVQSWEQSCEQCGSNNSFLDELIVDDSGKRRFVCSDTDYCHQQLSKLL